MWLFGSPPPETVAVLITFAVMFCGTFTTSKMGGYDAPGARLSLRVHVSVAVLQVHPVPLMDAGTKV